MTSGDRDGAWIVCPRRTTLVRRESSFPAWSAEIDGRPTSIHTFKLRAAGHDWALLVLLAGVLILVPSARSASSFRVRR